MRPLQPRDAAASVRQRLLNLARNRREDFQGILTRHALERLLYRLSRSAYRDQYILKDALLFSVWSDEPHRATRDLDLLGRGASTISRAEHAFRDLCGVPVEDDGLEFLAETVKATQVREDQQYEGQ